MFLEYNLLKDAHTAKTWRPDNACSLESHYFRQFRNNLLEVVSDVHFRDATTALTMLSQLNIQDRRPYAYSRIYESCWRDL